jgi:hypothetical protein
MNFPGQLLIELLPPPEIPVEASGNWANVERQLGTTLPSDYKWFIETYGTGGICTDYINVLNPFAENPALNLIAHSKVTLDVYRRVLDHNRNVLMLATVEMSSSGRWGLAQRR